MRLRGVLAEKGDRNLREKGAHECHAYARAMNCCRLCAAEARRYTSYLLHILQKISFSFDIEPNRALERLSCFFLVTRAQDCLVSDFTLPQIIHGLLDTDHIQLVFLDSRPDLRQSSTYGCK